nr:immunoglobulin light chain junction region [Macaca mulatta]MOX83689.1 immunoglobulin light chain junction region [Macaca mulatta]MOX83812.1 immunoglobulin light chain junction region [Macaca mulatta]
DYFCCSYTTTTTFHWVF